MQFCHDFGTLLWRLHMLKLLNLLVSLRQLPPLSELTGDEERLLFQLKALFDAQGALSVADVYDLIHGKSGTTAYRQLMRLKEKGLVVVEVDAGDKRRRHIQFTALADSVFRAVR
jgi:DNA-binding MarR family transcriptional regulator